MKAPLDKIPDIKLHVVSEIVETELIVGAVGDVAGIGGLSRSVIEAMNNDADGQAEEFIDSSHPLRITLGQVVVHRHEMDAPACERIEIQGERGSQGLALTGLHLGDLSFVKHDSTDELNIEVPHAEHAHRGLANHGEGLRKQIFQGLSL